MNSTTGRFTFLLQLQVVITSMSPLFVCGDRRRINNQSPLIDKTHVVTPISIEEGALLGSCTAEDCILGGSTFASYPPQAIPVRRANQCLTDESERDEYDQDPKIFGFGPPTAFKAK